MKALALLCALGCARAERMPECTYPTTSSCISRDSRYTDDGWLFKEYLIEAAESAAKSKHAKYSALESAYDFVPVAIETAGPWGSEARSFFRELGRRLRERGCDPRAGSYLVQQVSIAVQRVNAAGIMGTFESGVHMSVATRSGDYAVRWLCGGLNPTSYHAPRFNMPYLPYVAYEVELVDCNIALDSSYSDLFMDLNINSKYVKTLTISSSATRPQNSQWFSTNYLEKMKNEATSKNWLTDAAADLPKIFLEHLTLRRIPMTIEQFISIHNITSLTLVDTGLEEVMNLEEFPNLKRLELREPYLLNAEKLNASSIEELVLHAPDAGLAAMPQLRNATFIEVYMMGRLFGNCTNLEHLALIDGTLSVLPDHWLVGCSALKSLKLTQLRNLIEIPGDLLVNTTELLYLDLSHNSLETMPEGLLKHTRSLEYLDVSDNHLKTLSANLPVSLKYVYACGNDRYSFWLISQDLINLEDFDCIEITVQS